MKLLVMGANSAAELPGFDVTAIPGEVCFASDKSELEVALPGTDVLLGWNFRGRQLREVWHCADALKWIHWCGAGVDAVLFPELVDSDVVLSNSRGLFDRAMAEYVLGYMLFAEKQFAATQQAQRENRWEYRMTRKLIGQRAAIFGVGSIGREVARVLTAIGVEVIGVGRSERDDEQFGTVRANSNALEIAASCDWSIGVLPSTPVSDNFFTAEFFAAMPAHARFINIGRGRAQDEHALLAALQSGAIAGAMLDVFGEEPLPVDSPFWSTPNLFISPHISGDYETFETDMVALFMANLAHYARGETVENIVDKQLGFVRSQ